MKKILFSTILVVELLSCNTNSNRKLKFLLTNLSSYKEIEVSIIIDSATIFHKTLMYTGISDKYLIQEVEIPIGYHNISIESSIPNLKKSWQTQVMSDTAFIVEFQHTDSISAKGFTLNGKEEIMVFPVKY